MARREPVEGLKWLNSLWRGKPFPAKEHVGCTQNGACAGAISLAHFLLPAEEAEELEYRIMLRRKTTTFQKEMSFMAAQLETPVVLCITGAGWLVRSCLVVDHQGRREILADEAQRLFDRGVTVIRVDCEETMAITAFTNQPRFEKLHRHAYTPAPPPPPSPPLQPLPEARALRVSPTRELLDASHRALVAMGW